MDLTRDARLMRTDAGWVSIDPVTLTLSLVWRREVSEALFDRRTLIAKHQR